MGRNIVENTPLVPVISKAQFDNVATEFLKQYFPDALKAPMMVPIVEIAKKKLGLKIIAEYRLSEDFSIYGQICFTSGLATIYDRDEDEYRDIKVRRGTIFIDPDTIRERNLGCFHNTVAHECVHWHEHRNYYLCNAGADSTRSIAFRCPIEEKDERFQREWSDIDWMEWQANRIAPRILMPREMFTIAAETFIKEGRSILGNSLPSWWIQNKLAELFDVSKQSAGIRMNELGISVN